MTHRTVIITPQFLKPNPGHQFGTRQKRDVKEFMAKQHPNGYSICKDIEGLLQKLNTVKSYNEIPEKITVTYPDLISRGIDLKDTFDVISLTARLAANRFNEKPKEFLVSGHVGYERLAVADYKKLISAGFVGCSLSPMVHGVEAAAEVVQCLRKDPSYWASNATTEPVTITTHVPLKITLTFRQEQILKMICTHGMTNYQIARRLSLSESTVKMHIGVILKKYNAQHRTQLVVLDKQGVL